MEYGLLALRVGSARQCPAGLDHFFFLGKASRVIFVGVFWPPSRLDEQEERQTGGVEVKNEKWRTLSRSVTEDGVFSNGYRS